MPFVPFPITAQFNLRLLLNGQEAQSTLYFNHGFDSDWTGETLQQACQILRGWWITRIRPQVSNTVTLTEVVGFGLYDENAVIVSWSGDGPTQGVLEQEALPNNVSFAISFRTGLRGRGARGRNYAYGLTEPQTSGNIVLPTVISGWLAAYNQLQTEMDALDAVWVVASRRRNNAWLPEGISTVVQNAVVKDNYVDSQRRRLPGRGR